MSDSQAVAAPIHDSRFTGTLALGLLTFLVEGFFAIQGLVSMAQGSCSASLISLWFGAPLVAVSVGAFVVGSILGRNEGPRQKTSRAIGLGVALAAIPVWVVLAGTIAEAMKLG